MSTRKPVRSTRGVVHEPSKSIGDLVRLLQAADAEKYLYRGQNGVFGPNGDFTRQIPAVFRGCDTEATARKALRVSRKRVAWLISVVREVVKRSPIDSGRQALERPVTLGREGNLLFAAIHLGDVERPNSPPAILGIAQHYGIPTENLDLTNLEPAAVFATQRWLRIDEAEGLAPGSIVPPAGSDELGFIYRFDRERLLEFGVSAGDLSSGNAGSRPILQEARVIALDFNQDLTLFEAGAYEVFPFQRSRIPYVYRRSIRPSPLLNGDQRLALEAVSKYVRMAAPIAIRDLVVPSFYFSALPFKPHLWRAYIGQQPDPFLSLGREIEEKLHRVRCLNRYRSRARRLFGDCYDRCINEDPRVQKFVASLRAQT